MNYDLNWICQKPEEIQWGLWVLPHNEWKSVRGHAALEGNISVSESICTLYIG